jgi:hypothetical protein
MAMIKNPADGATVSTSFQTDGTTNPKDATVSARVVSQTNPQTQYPGSPASMKGPNFVFTFRVPADAYWLEVSGDDSPAKINITCKDPPPQ